MLSVFDESVTFGSVLSLERYRPNLAALPWQRRGCEMLVINDLSPGSSQCARPTADSRDVGAGKGARSTPGALAVT